MNQNFEDNEFFRQLPEETKEKLRNCKSEEEAALITVLLLFALKTLVCEKYSDCLRKAYNRYRYDKL